jgi:hypothetical protein
MRAALGSKPDGIFSFCTRLLRGEIEKKKFAAMQPPPCAALRRR